MTAQTYVTAVKITGSAFDSMAVPTVAGGIFYCSDPTQYPIFTPMSSIVPSRSQSSIARTLNTIFQVSAAQWSTVNYSVDISTTVSLSGSQVGTVILEMATNSSFTTGVQTLRQFSNGNSGTLVIGLVLTQLATACLFGTVPPGNYVRIRTVNMTGTPTFTYQAGQEVLF